MLFPPDPNECNEMKDESNDEALRTSEDTYQDFICTIGCNSNTITHKGEELKELIDWDEEIDEKYKHCDRYDHHKFYQNHRPIETVTNVYVS